MDPADWALMKEVRTGKGPIFVDVEIDGNTQQGMVDRSFWFTNTLLIHVHDHITGECGWVLEHPLNTPSFTIPEFNL